MRKKNKLTFSERWTKASVPEDLYWRKMFFRKDSGPRRKSGDLPSKKGEQTSWRMYGLIRKCWASLVVQWLRIRLPMQGTWVRALVWEDPTCHRATKPLRHNYWACTLEPASHNYWACVPQLLKPTRLEPVLCNKRSHRNEKPAHCNEE